MIDSKKLRTRSIRGLQMAACFIVVVTVASSIVHGRYTNRWGAPADLAAAGKRLQSMDTVLGKWQMTEEKDIDATALEVLEHPAYVHRTYVNEESGDQITLAVLVGLPGPISVHSPDVCYSSRDTTIIEKDSVALPTRNGTTRSTFWRRTFQSAGLSGDTFRVFFAWSTDGETWVAADNPRLQFGGAGVLYKIQLMADDLPEDADNDPAEDFLSALRF